MFCNMSILYIVTVPSLLGETSQEEPEHIMNFGCTALINKWYIADGVLFHVLVKQFNAV